MKTTLQYIDDLKRRLGVSSDYAIAKALQVPRATVSNYRIGRSHFDDRIALRVAELLGLDPAVVVVDMEIERASSPELEKMWKSIARKVASVAAIGVGLYLLVSTGGDLTITELVAQFAAVPLALSIDSASAIHIAGFTAVIVAMAVLIIRQRGRWWPGARR